MAGGPFLILAFAALACAQQHICKSDSFSCRENDECSESWPPTHPNAWRVCDTTTGACVPMQCGLVDGVWKRCPEGERCHDFQCHTSKTKGQACDNEAEWSYDDECYGAELNCFAEDSVNYKCVSNDDIRGIRECVSSSDCPENLRCRSYPDGKSRCIDSVFLKAGESCAGSSSTFRCLGQSHSRGFCDDETLCQHYIPASPAAKATCPSRTCTRSSECDSYLCIDGTCHDSELLIGESCQFDSQCILGNCTSGECAAAGGETDCGRVTCNEGHYCSRNSQDESLCLLYCDPDTSKTYYNETHGYYCAPLPPPTGLDNGEPCTRYRDRDCKSQHCFSVNSTYHFCAPWAEGQSPLGTQCTFPSRTDTSCASGVCGKRDGVCIEPSQRLPQGAECTYSTDSFDQCSAGLYCGTQSGSSSVYTCLPFARDTCESGVAEFDTSCGGSYSYEPGLCSCSDAGDYTCVDRRVHPDARSDHEFELDYYYADEFDVAAVEALALGGCSSYSPSSSSDWEIPTNKCVQQIQRRENSPNFGGESEFEGLFPMEMTPYWLRRAIADMDDECRAATAAAVCCAACGASTPSNPNLPTVSRFDIGQGRIWDSAYFSGWSTSYIAIDCAVPTIHPVWDACAAVDDSITEMNVEQWAQSISACAVDPSNFPQTTVDLSDAAFPADGTTHASAILAALALLAG